MGTELTVAIKNGLQKSAKEVLEHTDELQKKLDNLVIEENNLKRKLTNDEIDDFFKHLEKVAEIDFMAKPAEIGRFGGKKLTASQIRKYKGWLKRNGVETFFEEDLILNKFGKITNKETLNKFKPFMSDGIQFDTLQDFYSYMKQEGGLGVFHAKTKQLFLTKEPTELMSFHEKMHVKHYLEIGEKYHTLPSWERETYVFLEIWKQKHLYTKQELEFSLKYVDLYRKEAGQKLLNYKI